MEFETINVILVCVAFIIEMYHNAGLVHDLGGESKVARGIRYVKYTAWGFVFISMAFRNLV